LPDSVVSAFNNNGHLFFNAALHNSAHDIFLSVCHELTHNDCKQHDWRFVAKMENCVAAFIADYIQFTAASDISSLRNE